MAKTPKQRQQDHRDRLKAAGYRGLTVYLPAATFKALDRLKAGRAGTNAEKLAAVIAEAVEALDRQQQAVTSHAPRRHQSRNQSRPAVTSHAPPAAGQPFTPLPPEREALFLEALELVEQGIRPKAIAEQWNRAGKRNGKGGAWTTATVSNWLQREKRRRGLEV